MRPDVRHGWHTPLSRVGIVSSAHVPFSSPDSLRIRPLSCPICLTIKTKLLPYAQFLSNAGSGGGSGLIVAKIISFFAKWTATESSYERMAQLQQLG